MSISISGVNRTQLQQINNSRLNAPDWSRIPHAGMETPPKDELVQQIKDTGIKFAQAKSEAEKSAILSKMEKLEAQYASSVSPDRKALYDDAIKVINQHKAATSQKQPRPILDFAEYLAQHDGIKTRQYDLTNQPEVLSSGGTVGAACRGFLGYDYMINAGGQQVMSTNFAGTGWCYTRTPAECDKIEEFTKIFNKAKDNEIINQKDSSSSQQNGVNSDLSVQNHFYLKA